MNAINKIIFGACVLFFTFSLVNAQSSVTVDVSQNITNFSFTNSLGEKVKDYNPKYSAGYAIGYRYSLDNGIYIPAKLGMRKAGATYVYDSMNYDWDFRYAEVRLGGGYNYELKNSLSVHGSIMGYMGFLLTAEQRINNEYFDIKESGQLSKSDFGIFISPGVSYALTDKMSLYLDINYMMGLKNLESDEGQKSKNRLFGASVGVAFSL